MNLVVIVFVAVFLAVSAGTLLLLHRRTLASRVSRAVGPGRSSAEDDLFADAQPSRLERLIGFFQGLVPRSSQEVSVVRKRLMLAGFRKPRHLDLFYASKILAPVGLAAAATVAGLETRGPFFVYATAAAAGFLGPDFWVGWRMRKRQLELRLALPEALDLMTVCVEAGLGLDEAILRVSDEMKHSRPEIAEELAVVNFEQRAGTPTEEALRNLAERTDVESIRSLVAVLIQTNQFGTSIADTLRVHSDSLRVQRRQEVEEMAAKTSVKLIFPLVFFIFPSLFVVTLGPAFLKILESFETYF